MATLPWECVVHGVPASLQSKSTTRARWKTTVAAAATSLWPAGDAPLAVPVQVAITYFFEDSALDVDNMLKPIQDALIGIALEDDKHVTDVRGAKRDLANAFVVKGMSRVMADGFISDGPFVHIKIDLAPDHKELP
ncbi:RusA family crossover junction endodeoxyribonuclease [Streptomyces sp. NPDC088674]|uniref:RusA family crossover junction endodeoxyribonuclease n=1 Tax=Streptomyces sp. NPDC088674 TaxID=3365869 RepID=UPI0037F307BB